MGKGMKRKPVCKRSQLAQSVGTVRLCVAFITYSLAFDGVWMKIVHLHIQYVGNAAVECCAVKAELVFLNLYPCGR